MDSIGETLRRERLRRNLDLDQISRELKISSKFLEAIEDERFDRLPAGVFARSFVRQYARLLELDEEELASQVQHAIAPEPAAAPSTESWHPHVQDIHVPRVEEWEAVSDRGRFQWSSSLPAFALVVVVMLVCSGVYSFWQRMRRPVVARESPPAAVRTVQPAAPPQPAPAVSPAVPEQPAPAPSQTATAEQAPPQPAPGSPASNPAPERREQDSADRPVPETPAGTPPRPVQPVFAPNPNATVRVELTADEPVWVLARADGKYLFSGTLEPNKTRVVEATGTLLLRLGNAGGVSITLNGKPIGPVGAKGQVRDVQFTSGGFQIVAAPKPSLPLVDEPF